MKNVRNEGMEEVKQRGKCSCGVTVGAYDENNSNLKMGGKPGNNQGWISLVWLFVFLFFFSILFCFVLYQEGSVDVPKLLAGSWDAFG